MAALEAADLGAPIVITRNGGPMDYFGSEVAYVDPYSEADIACALERARSQKVNATREHLELLLRPEARLDPLIAAYALALE